MSRISLVSLFIVGVLASLSTAFVPQRQHNPRPHAAVALPAAKNTPWHNNEWDAKIIATASAFVMANAVPLIALAAEAEENYEYGAVDAPIGLAIGGGILAILTALLPIALKGGEEAFEEIKDRDQSSFGKQNKDVLQKKKK